MTVGSRTQVIVHLDHIRHNLRNLFRLATSLQFSSTKMKKAFLGKGENGQGPLLLPMVKADAYGHGLVPVSKAIERESFVYGVGVATLEEALELRAGGFSGKILVFSLYAPFQDEIFSALLKYKLTPVIHTQQDLVKILAHREKLSFHLKVNTGFNRLGVSFEEWSSVRKKLMRASSQFEGVCTHFASPEQPHGKLSKKQIEGFLAVLTDLSGGLPPFVHCASTRALEETEELGLSGICNLARPGIGIYGYGLTAALSAKLKIKPALSWLAQVIAIRHLKAGDYVGYGGSHQTSRAMDEAILSVGYGDGLRRLVSNGLIQNHRVLGRVSMDLTCIEAKKLKRGQWFELLSPNIISGELLSKESQTIIYEVLTSISSRVPRVYKGHP